MQKKENFFSWLNPNLEVRDTGKYGKGVFAIKDIKKGELLSVFGGYIVKYEDEPVDSGIQIYDDLILSSLGFNEPADFINHSCNPNSGIKGQNFLVAMKNIKKNDQITFDYAMCLFSTTKKADYTLKCECGNKDCRKIITSHDWKIPELQKKYFGYFEYFLQEKINRLK